MTTPKPLWVEEYGSSYESMLSSAGLDILEWQAVGDYQGDYYTVVRDSSGRYGFTVIGYGSCSGCDALEAATPWYSDEDPDWSDIVSLREDILSGVRYFDSKAEIAEFIQVEIEKNSGKDWYYYDDEILPALRELAKSLED